ncbi:polysaccharide lyase 6 family protein [Gammaproteobacteria bacterium]|nr:polysaccharide lyase 6 family protein [Gammaproteobacteria bacterium]
MLNLSINGINSKFILIFFILSTLPLSYYVSAEDFLVSTQSEYKEKIKNIQPGDTILLKDGIWRNFEILFLGYGLKGKPITLRAQTNGNVLITGKSNLRIAGKHLVVSGLIFKDGYTPTSSVIEFRKNKDNLAYHSRVTEVVIDNFSNPERTENDSWVMMYGKHNRFDHNHLEGKTNKGVTMAIRLNSVESQENYHSIDNNYFGPRQILGSNGGETLRIGTSHHSLTNSFTIVKNNYFDRCDGELEIISNKSGSNKFIGNVFFQSKGTLTMRHGNDTLVEDNIFFGNGVDHTGGIRVINKRQTVRNNYIEGLKGYRFGSAIAVMNGVPNSKINRYHQVEDSVVENNTVINSDHIQFASGSDAERSAVPIRSHFKDNLIYQKNQIDPFTVFDDISGITISDNRINKITNFQFKDGFIVDNIEFTRLNNKLLYPKDKSILAGVSRDLLPINKADVGVSWYPKTEILKSFDFGRSLSVSPGDNTIFNAIKDASDGDILILEPGEYRVQKVLEVNKSVSISSKDNSSVKIYFARGALFEIQNRGNLKLSNITISGAEAPDSSGNSVIRTNKSITDNYKIIISDSNIVDLNINHSFNFISPSKSSFADLIEISNTNFLNITGSVVLLNMENEDYGIYNAEYITIKNSLFKDIEGSIVNIYRGGTDESTFGPHLKILNSTIVNAGNGKRNKSRSSLNIHGVQVTNIENNTFEKSTPINVIHTVGEPVTKIINNTFSNTSGVKVLELNSDQENTALLINNTYN